MPEKMTMTKISVVTDDDTGMYSIGEIDGMFCKKELREHIESHGSQGLIEHLAFLQYQVIEMKRSMLADQTPKEFSDSIKHPSQFSDYSSGHVSD